jgi:hypothetical protein
LFAETGTFSLKLPGLQPQAPLGTRNSVFSENNAPLLSSCRKGLEDLYASLFGLLRQSLKNT